MIVEHRFEGGTAIGRLPDAPARRPHVEDTGILRRAGDGHDAPTHHRGPDLAWFEIGKRVAGDGDLGDRGPREKEDLNMSLPSALMMGMGDCSALERQP